MRGEERGSAGLGAPIRGGGASSAGSLWEHWGKLTALEQRALQRALRWRPHFPGFHSCSRAGRSITNSGSRLGSKPDLHCWLRAVSKSPNLSSLLAQLQKHLLAEACEKETRTPKTPRTRADAREHQVLSTILLSVLLAPASVPTRSLSHAPPKPAGSDWMAPWSRCTRSASRTSLAFAGRCN